VPIPPWDHSSEMTPELRQATGDMYAADNSQNRWLLFLAGAMGLALLPVLVLANSPRSSSAYSIALALLEAMLVAITAILVIYLVLWSRFMRARKRWLLLEGRRDEVNPIMYWIRNGSTISPALMLIATLVFIGAALIGSTVLRIADVVGGLVLVVVLGARIRRRT
jgi:hypothetical protein